ncbi:MAG: phosphate ABC transporter permease PstA [Rhodospirillales bacterium]|nr:phosphate ABC transporter permease PstA [Rhodospirillales bacterium]
MAAVQNSLVKRNRAERRFRAFGVLSIGIAMTLLAILFWTIISSALPAFTETTINLEISLPADQIDPDSTGNAEIIGTANFPKYVKQTLYELFPEVKSRKDKKQLAGLVSPGAAFMLREVAMSDPSLVGGHVTLRAIMSDDVDQFTKGQITEDTPESDRRISDKQIKWLKALTDKGMVTHGFNWTFFTSGDSREPELAGIWGAIVGSVFVMIITLCLSFPIGVASAVYLEEFAPKNRLSDIIEVNINNLAAVPSIVFGLLGLALFLNFFGLPRSAPLVGGMVLALMTLPTIIIASRASLKSVPPSIREAALGLGASKAQAVAHHVVPLALPGMLTGAIIGMARALGETAPLLMIGMVAFIVDFPSTFTDPSTVLPVQIYLWADAPERAFIERSSATTLVLLCFLIVMNGLAVILRKRFERRW